MDLPRYRWPLLLGVAIVLAVAPGEAFAACQGAGQAVGSPSAAERSGVCLITQERRQRSRRALDSNPKLDDAAVSHTRDMVSSGFFSHSGSNGSSPNSRIRKTGYLKGAKNWGVGETIAYETGNGSSPRNIVDGWMRSAGHRSILLDGNFRNIGVGVKRGTPGGGRSSGATYTATFGYRK